MTTASPTRSPPLTLSILDQPALRYLSILSFLRLHHKHTYLRACAYDLSLSLEREIRLYTISFPRPLVTKTTKRKIRNKTLPKLTNEQYKRKDGTGLWGTFLHGLVWFAMVSIKSGLWADLCVYEDLRCFWGERASFASINVLLLSAYLSTGLTWLGLGSFPGGWWSFVSG